MTGFFLSFKKKKNRFLFLEMADMSPKCVTNTAQMVNKTTFVLELVTNMRYIFITVGKIRITLSGLIFRNSSNADSYHVTNEPMKSTKRFFANIAIVGGELTITACSFMGPEKATWQEDKEYRVTILHTNDHHGRFWQNNNGEYGMAARKTLIDNLREDVILNNGHSLLLSGGDINTGVPESDLQDAEPDFRGMNMLKYDAMAVGNHEFDNPLSVLRKQQEWAGFPFLSANIFDANTGERLLDAYKIFQIDDVKVAVVGFTTDDTIKQGNPEIIHRHTDKITHRSGQDTHSRTAQKSRPRHCCHSHGALRRWQLWR